MPDASMEDARRMKCGGGGIQMTPVFGIGGLDFSGELQHCAWDTCQTSNSIRLGEVLCTSTCARDFGSDLSASNHDTMQVDYAEAHVLRAQAINNDMAHIFYHHSTSEVRARICQHTVV
jgi:hypothetical protein